MNKILTVIMKNLKLLLRSRVSALVIIFGPLLLTLLVGMAFNNRALTSIKIGTYSPDYNPLVTSFLDKIVESKLSILRFESEQQCADSIKSSTVNLCLVFPKDFEIAKDSSSATNTITYYVDPSQLNLVYNVKDIISTQLENRTEELSAELTTILLDTLDDARTRIAGDAQAFSDIAKATDTLKARQQNIRTKLGAIDLNFNQNRFGVDSIEDASDSISKYLAGSNGTIRVRLNQSVALAWEILSDMRASPSLNGTSLEEDMTDLYSKIKNLNTEITKLDEDSIEGLNQGLLALKKELNSTSRKFTQMKTSRDDILAVDLKEMTSATDTILDKMMDIKGDVDSIKSNIDSIEVKESSSIVSPIRTEIKPIVSETYLNYMFPGLIALVVMLVSLLFAQTIVMMEKKSSAHFRNIVTPNRESLFMFSNFLTTFLLVFAQILLILSVSAIVFKVDVAANLPSTLIGMLLIVTLFTVVGIMIGTLFSSQETSMLAAVSFGSIALFISDIILPLESMPPYIRQVAQFNPFVLGEYVLRNTIVFKTSLLTLLRDPYLSVPLPVILLLVLYIFFFLATLVVLNSLINRRRIDVKKQPKKQKPKPGEKKDAQPDLEIIDPVQKIEDLINTAFKQIKEKEFDKASVIYVHLNELYALLPPEKKREYFKKIVKIHVELEKMNKHKK